MISATTGSMRSADKLPLLAKVLGCTIDALYVEKPTAEDELYAGPC